MKPSQNWKWKRNCFRSHWCSIYFKMYADFLGEKFTPFRIHLNFRMRQMAAKKKIQNDSCAVVNENICITICSSVQMISVKVLKVGKFSVYMSRAVDRWNNYYSWFLCSGKNQNVCIRMNENQCGFRKLNRYMVDIHETPNCFMAFP